MSMMSASEELPATSLHRLIGAAVEDASEETFLLFSQQFPSQNLGMVDTHSRDITVEVGNRDIHIRQSPGLLTSDRKTGTTGATLWKITPIVAEWLISPSGILWKTGILYADANVVEMGCGISGVLGIALAPRVGSYLLTDQDYVMKVLRENIAANPPVQKRNGRKHGKSNGMPRTLPFDWETDDAPNLRQIIGYDKSIDIVIACDCIYNDFLIKPFVDACAEVCMLRPENGRETVVVVAQQLRSETIFEDWLETMLRTFRVWRLPDDYCIGQLKSGSGYVVHFGVLKERC